jgi:hypothetical protein
MKLGWQCPAKRMRINLRHKQKMDEFFLMKFGWQCPTKRSEYPLRHIAEGWMKIG